MCTSHKRKLPRLFCLYLTSASTSITHDTTFLCVVQRVCSGFLRIQSLPPHFLVVQAGELSIITSSCFSSPPPLPLHSLVSSFFLWILSYIPRVHVCLSTCVRVTVLQLVCEKCGSVFERRVTHPFLVAAEVPFECCCFCCWFLHLCARGICTGETLCGAPFQIDVCGKVGVRSSPPFSFSFSQYGSILVSRRASKLTRRRKVKPSVRAKAAASHSYQVHHCAPSFRFRSTLLGSCSVVVPAL